MNELLYNIMIEAGKIAINEQKKLNCMEKEDKSILTNGDLKVSAFLENQLKTLYPTFDIFSEENCKKIPTRDKIIVIDPIDGTESYSKNQSKWSILVGFMEKGEITGGIVYFPSLNKMYYGFMNQGAYLIDNDVERQLKAHNDNIEPTGLISPNDNQAEAFLNRNKFYNISTDYSTAYKIIQIVEGNFDIFANFRQQCGIWDLIAPVAILQEAGGSIIYDNYKEYDFNNYQVKSNFCVLNKKFYNLNLINFK